MYNLNTHIKNAYLVPENELFYILDHFTTLCDCMSLMRDFTASFLYMDAWIVFLEPWYGCPKDYKPWDQCVQAMPFFC